MANTPSSTGPTTPPGWYPDPQNPAGGTRWWDGTQWSSKVGPAPTYPGQAPVGVAPSMTVPPAPRPIPPATGLMGLYQQNQFSALTVAISLVYLVVGAAIHVVFFGIIPVVLTVRAFSRKEPYAFVGAIAAAVAVILALSGV